MLNELLLIIGFGIGTGVLTYLISITRKKSDDPPQNEVRRISSAIWSGISMAISLYIVYLLRGTLYTTENIAIIIVILGTDTGLFSILLSIYNKYKPVQAPLLSIDDITVELVEDIIDSFKNVRSYLLDKENANKKIDKALSLIKDFQFQEKQIQEHDSNGDAPVPIKISNIPKPNEED